MIKAAGLWLTFVALQTVVGGVRAEESERFQATSAGTIVEPASGLEWTAADNGFDLDWTAAQRFCADLRLDGRRDWRLPTAAELLTLVDPSGRDNVDCSVNGARFYKSLDAGRTFECVSDWADLPSRNEWSFPPRPGTYHVRWIAHGPDGSLHVSIEFGAVLRSRDQGRSFSDRLPDSPRDAHVLSTHPAVPHRLYAALGDGIMVEGRSWATSDDGGETWCYASEGLQKAPYLYGLAVNPIDPEDLRVAASPNPVTAHRTGPSTIFRQEAGVWREDADGFPCEQSRVPVLAADPRKPGRWLALSNLGLFEQTGGDWRCLAELPEWYDRHPTCVAVAPD